MDDLKVLPLRQRLSVLNNLFGTSKGMNGSFTPAPNQDECSTANISFSVHFKGVSISVTPLLSLRFADSGGEAAVHHLIIMTGCFIPPYRIPISDTRSRDRTECILFRDFKYRYGSRAPNNNSRTFYP